ncbi:MAG: hypothetical protein FWG42_12085 [Clostridiales bacterium]|nr:hypothetical protein [Clostridiales bacterium]
MLDQNNVVRIRRIKKKALEKAAILNPVVPEEAVREFELANDILLPEELFGFYTMVGNGGKMFGGYPQKSLKKFEDLTIDIEKVKKEFPYTEYWVWEDEEEDVDLGEVGNGNIELMDLGDGQTWNIIVTGKERGQMWIFSDVGIEPCAPKRDFLSWYESWLDGNDDYFAGFED